MSASDAYTINKIDKKYINAVNSKPAVAYCIFPAVSSKKSEIRLSPNGCVIAAVKRNITLTLINNISGSNSTATIKKILILPNAFLIKILPATAKSKPPDKKPPTIGTPLPIAYFIARRTMPSCVAAVIPCNVKNNPNTDTQMPISHLFMLLKNAENLLIFNSFVKFPAIEKAIIVIVKVNTMLRTTETIVFVKKATVGRQTDADTTAPLAASKVNNNG